MFSYTILGFTETQAALLNDPAKVYFQITPGSYKSDETVNSTGTVKIHSKCDCFKGSIAKGVREPILFSFALDKPPGHKKTERT